MFSFLLNLWFLRKNDPNNLAFGLGVRIVNRHYIPEDLKDLKKGFLDPSRGLSALQKGHKT